MKEEVALGVALAALGAVFAWQAGMIPGGRSLVGPRALPMLTSCLLIAGGVLISVQAWLGRTPAEPKAAEHKLMSIVLPGVGVALVFLWLWSALGWTLAALMVAPVFFFIFGARGWRELLLFPAGAVLVLYLIFYRLLGLWHGTGWLIERMGLS